MNYLTYLIYIEIDLHFYNFVKDKWSKIYVKWVSQTFELLKNKQKFITTLIYNTLTENSKRRCTELILSINTKMQKTQIPLRAKYNDEGE